jgi:D-alanyl-lipoteichoic acid acyltransferase DltB (MBOAT superfamily)
LLGHSVRSSSQNLLQTSYIASALVPVSYGVIKILETYALQSGLASLQIGMMRWSGYKIAERYHYPLASRNPIEFWRRWNTYVGNWTRRYLYFPIALRIARRCDLGLIGRAIPVVFAFTAMGALHDVYALVAGPTVTYQATLFFFLNAILLIAWIGITQRSYWASKGRLVETRNAVNPAQSILE